MFQENLPFFSSRSVPLDESFGELIKRQEANQAALKNAFKKLGYDKAFEEVRHD